MTTPILAPPTALHADHLLEPAWATVTGITAEAQGVSTFWLQFRNTAIRSLYSFQPGQFNMVYIPGFGEAAISISSDSEDPGTFAHTIRSVGRVTRSIARLDARD